MPTNAESLSRAILAFAAVAFGGVVAIGRFGTPNIRLCNPSTLECRNLSDEEYAGLKLALADKIESGEALTWEEYNLLVATLNRELRVDDLEITNVDGEESIRQGLINKLREE